MLHTKKTDFQIYQLEQNINNTMGSKLNKNKVKAALKEEVVLKDWLLLTIVSASLYITH